MFVRRHTGVARETNGLTCGCVYEREDERKKREGRNGEEEEILKRRMGQEMSRRKGRKESRKEGVKEDFLSAKSALQKLLAITPSRHIGDST